LEYWTSQKFIFILFFLSEKSTQEKCKEKPESEEDQKSRHTEKSHHESISPEKATSPTKNSNRKVCFYTRFFIRNTLFGFSFGVS